MEFHIGMMGSPEEVETQKSTCANAGYTIIAITSVTRCFLEVPASCSLFQEKSDDRLLHGAFL